MPLINGCKYSCEPCIRGHRATSCVHNDRILIEVRKPGRPLQSCGHKLDTCSCGRLSEAFSIGEGDMDQNFTQEPGTVFITTQAMTPTMKAKPKTKDRVAGRARVTKRRVSKTASPTMSGGQPINIPPAAENQKETTIPIKVRGTTHQRDLLSAFPFKSPTTSIVSPNYVFEHPASPPTQMLPSITPLLGIPNSNSRQEQKNQQATIMESTSQQNVQVPSPNYSSRIEDISVISKGQFPSNRQGDTQIRSRYITTAQNSMWKRHSWHT